MSVEIYFVVLSFFVTNIKLLPMPARKPAIKFVCLSISDCLAVVSVCPIG